MGLSFPKQVQRRPGEWRWRVQLRFLGPDGLVAKDLAEEKTFTREHEAHAFAQSMVGCVRGRVSCYAALVGGGRVECVN